MAFLTKSPDSKSKSSLNTCQRNKLSSLPLQAKLRMGKPHDAYEQEANRVADRVMGMSEAQVQRQTEEEEVQTLPLVSQITPLVQRQEEEEKETAQTLQRQEEEEKETAQPLQRQEEEEEETAQPLQRQEKEEEETAQAKTFFGPTPRISANLESRIQSQRAGGQILPESARNFFEPRFGTNFSGVRVHTDAEANSLSREINARAFTVGRDIFVGSGQYNPYSSAGRSLLAHELTHTIQQQPNTASRQVVQRRLAKPSTIPVAKSPEPRSPLAPSSLAIAKLPPSSSPALPAKAAPESPSESELKAATETGTVVSPKSKGQVLPAPVPLTPTAAVPVPEKALSAIAIPKEAAEEKVTPEPSAAAPAVTAEPSVPRSPQDDPDFQAVVKQVKQVSSKQQHHAPASSKVKEAQDAAVSPTSERESKAQANQVGQMAQVQPPAFNAAAFKVALLDRIAKLAPKTLQGVDEFKKSNKLSDAKQAMTAQVQKGKAASQKPLVEKTQQKPDTSSIKPKPVTKLPPVAAGKAPTSIGAGRATPKPQPASMVETPLQKGSQQLNQQMIQAGVTDQQLAQSNEPTFQEALTAKQTAQQHSVAAPQAYRQSEQNQLSQTKGEATASAQAQLQEMHSDRTQLQTQVLGLTWDYIRTKAVKLFGEPVVAAMEKAVAIFKILRKEGAKGLWKYVQKQFTDLKQQVIDQIKGLVITQVITAGVKWILSLLSPAGALVKAATAIYEIVMFFVDRGSQILQLVNSVVDAVAAIAKGAIGGAAKLVETTLVRVLPLVIGFLASLLRLSGLAKKVEVIIGKIRKRIDKAIDSLLQKVKKLFRIKKDKSLLLGKKSPSRALKKKAQKALARKITALRKRGLSWEKIIEYFPKWRAQYRFKKIRLTLGSDRLIDIAVSTSPEEIIELKDLSKEHKKYGFQWFAELKDGYVSILAKLQVKDETGKTIYWKSPGIPENVKTVLKGEEELKKELEKPGRGSNLFAITMKFYEKLQKARKQAKVKGVIGNWNAESEIADNINAVNKALRNGKGLRDGIKEAWTYQQAKEWGFTQIDIPPKSKRGVRYKFPVSLGRDKRYHEELKAVNNALKEAKQQYQSLLVKFRKPTRWGKVRDFFERQFEKLFTAKS